MLLVETATILSTVFGVLIGIKGLAARARSIRGRSSVR